MITNQGASKLVPVAKLAEHPRNVNEGDVGAIHQSITHNGFYGALVVQQSTGHVLVGNHRLRAAIAAGLAKVPVFYVDVDDDRALKIMLADNRTGELASRDEEALAALLQEIAEGSGLDGTGYDGDDLDELLGDLVSGYPGAEDPGAQMDRADELREQWGTALGQVWQIGAHRIVCGDSTDAATIALAVGDTPAAMVFTDPPYGVDYDGGTKKRKRIGNDHLKGAELRDFIASALAGAATATRPGGAVYVAAPARPLHRFFMEAFGLAGVELRQTIIWVKDNSTFGPLGQDYHWRHEPILYGHVRGAAHVWHGDRTQDTVWEIARPSASPDHPTMKPVPLMVRAIRNSTEHGEGVLDVFMGSGSTIIACEETGRRGYGVDIDPRYVAVALQRLHDMGLTPTQQ